MKYSLIVETCSHENNEDCNSNPCSYVLFTNDYVP